MTATATARLRDEGSATVELVILAPLLAALLLFVAGLGRLAESRALVDSAARDAARAASLERTPAAAAAAARTAARAALVDGVRCADLSVTVDVSGYQPGGQVTATVRCTTRLADLGLAGFPATKTQVATSVAPIEAWRGQ